MLRQAENLGRSSGVDVVCEVPCRVLEGANWKLLLQNMHGNIIFTDEENAFINTEEFAAEVRNSDNYFVLITRENLYNLPYSVEEIYGLHASGKYQNTKKVYQQMYQIYSEMLPCQSEPEKLLVEDSNSGYQFFEAIGKEYGIECESAGGKSNLFDLIKKTGKEETCVIADGAAIGPEMNRLYKQVKVKSNVKLYLPESFEWIILQSGIVDEKEIRTILLEPEQYIDSTATDDGGQLTVTKAGTVIHVDCSAEQLAAVAAEPDATFHLTFSYSQITNSGKLKSITPAG